MDLKVLFLTVKVVFDRSDVAEDTSQAEGNFARISGLTEPGGWRPEEDRA